MVLKLIQFLGTNHTALGIASLCTIIGFFLTIVVTIRTSHISKLLKYNDTVAEYNKKKQGFQRTFDGHRISILEDENKTDRLLKDILKNVEEYDSLFRTLLPWTERITLWRFKRVLKKPADMANFNTICNYLAVLSGRLSKKEDKRNV